MDQQYKVFETERLFVRPTDESDAEFVLELLNSPKWIANIGQRNVSNVAEAKTYIRSRMLTQLKRLGFSNYTVIRKIDLVKMGSIGLYERTGLDVIDIGFAFLERFEGMGYAFESTFALKELARSYFGLSEISAITVKSNKSSQRLLDKLGLKFDKYINLPNDDEELMYYLLSFE